ncbi:MAG: hypothetical protein ICV64_03035 [Thermoleophilia bacterium]|nr:hypothetical protein [Thermoleophilia bacterium]
MVATAPDAVTPEPGEAPTPAATKLGLVATLAVTAGALAVFPARAGDPVDARFAAPFLFLFTGLFLLRVAGQLYVRRRRPAWLPPTEQWNLMPYHLLLPSQLVIIVVMLWLALSFAGETGPAGERHGTVGWAVIAFSGVYAGAMAVRYAVRMARRPEARWFGGTIPIVFHLVLASFLFVVGSFHAS